MNCLLCWLGMNSVYYQKYTKLIQWEQIAIVTITGGEKLKSVFYLESSFPPAPTGYFRWHRHSSVQTDSMYSMLVPSLALV